MRRLFCLESKTDEKVVEDKFWDSYPNAYEDYMPIAQQIFRSPWFRRVWTLQEVSLAQAKRVVMVCDDEEISWN